MLGTHRYRKENLQNREVVCCYPIHYSYKLLFFFLLLLFLGGVPILVWRGSLHHWQDPILSHFFSKNHSIPAVFSLRPILISFVLFCFFSPFFGFFPELWTFWITRLFFFFLPILFKRTNQSQESFDGTNFYLSFLSYTHGLCIQCKCSVNVLALISISSLKFTTKWCCFFLKKNFLL